MLVIHALEFVDINDHERKLHVGLTKAVHLSAGKFLEGPPVGNAGQCVRACLRRFGLDLFVQVIELCFGLREFLLHVLVCREKLGNKLLNRGTTRDSAFTELSVDAVDRVTVLADIGSDAAHEAVQARHQFSCQIRLAVATALRGCFNLGMEDPARSEPKDGEDNAGQKTGD